MLAIPDMSKPKTCEDCPCAYFTEGAYTDECQVTHNHITDEKPTDCPLVEIDLVRCKDCKYMTEHYDTDGNAPYWTCSEWDSGTDYDGFCHYGERREAMSKDIPTADILEWCKERNYTLVAREDFPYLFKDIVKCGECKYREKNHYCVKWGQPYLCKDECFCSYGERRADDKTEESRP